MAIPVQEHEKLGLRMGAAQRQRADLPPECADEIRERMSVVRNDLRNDIAGVAAQARHFADWRHHVRESPLASVAIAAVAGYLMVPQKTRLTTVDADAILKLADQNRVVVESKPKAAASGESGIIGFAMRLATTALVRAAVGYAAHKLGEATSDRPASKAQHEN
jgi:ElaB/YqjD/DUF883 family membrane-anchored ribosome-binding protein